MAKKKKSGQRGTESKSTSFGGSLKDQLKGIKVGKELPHRDAQEPEPEPIEYGKEAQAAPQEKLTDEQLFAQAVDGIDRADLYKGKYGMPGDDWEPDFYKQPEVEVPEDAPSPEDARAKLEELRDQRMLELAMGGIDQRIENPKYYVPEPKVTVEKQPSNLRTPRLDKDPESLDSVKLSGEQKELLKRFKKYEREHRVPEVNVRGESKAEALERVQAVLQTCVSRGDGFLRIIHGKGKQSEGDAVLKPAILEWLEGDASQYIIGYAPIVERDGRFGSVIVELKR